MRRLLSTTAALSRGKASSPPFQRSIVSQHLTKAEVELGAVFRLPQRRDLKKEIDTVENAVVNENVVKAAATNISERGKALRKMSGCGSSP